MNGDWGQLLYRRPSAATSADADSAAVSTHEVPGADGPRAGKGSRKRPRTSRKAPTTLLNTDTSNFRAMVQRFTGAASAPYAATSYTPGGPSTTGIGTHDPLPQPTVPPSFELLAHQQRQQLPRQLQEGQQLEYHFRPPPSQVMWFGGSTDQEDLQLQGLNNSNNPSPAAGLGLLDEFFLDGMGGQQAARPTGGDDHNGHHDHGYFCDEHKPEEKNFYA